MKPSTKRQKTALLIKYMIILLWCQSAIGSAFQFTVRDSHTGAPLDAKITLHSINQEQLTPDQWHQIKLGQKLPDEVLKLKQQELLATDHFFQVLPDKHLQVLTVSADGYQPLHTYLAANSHIPITQIMLDKTQETESKSFCDQAQLCGFLYDQTTAKPLTEVAVIISSGEFYAQMFTDHQGAFVFTEILPKNITLMVEHPGYQAQRWTDIDTQAQVHMVMDLKPGQGLQEKSLLHPLTGLLGGDIDHDWLSAKFNHENIHDDFISSRERSTGAVYLEPPSSIRVGFNGSGGTCCGSNCVTSQVYSLETYVQRGLDNEWISSWDPDSLKAGTIPFRSYGAWHVINQPYSGYDICAGPCCQAFEFTGFTSTINAGIATNGIMLDQNGALARSEYSAQNNSWDDPNDGLNCSNADLSCGDGSVGSPATGWTCLADPLAAGLGCFGHGRGMSQWGTQFRAQAGESFADIVDHYYNASNNPAGQRNQYASTPIRLDSISTDVPVITVNETFTIDFEVFNASDSTHPFGPVLLGASLFDGINYYSDPGNDVSFSITLSGNNTLQRSFQIDPSIPPGIYDLITALYLDVDQDGQIASTDWLLQVTTQPAVIEVLAENDLIFRDSFE